MDEGEAKARNRRLPILVGFWFVLGVQAAFAVAVVEPYPALVMPSFAGAAEANGHFPTTRLDISITYDEGPGIATTSSELMDGFRFSSALPSVRYMFHPDGAGVRRGLVEDLDVRAWLTERARALGDGRDPAAVNFCWRDEILDVDDGSLSSDGPCDDVLVTL